MLGLSFGIHAEKPFGKIPLVKNLVNSIVIGWKPNSNCKNLFDLYIITDNRGVEVRYPWIMATTANKVNYGRIERWGGEIYIQLNGLGQTFKLNDIGFGYYLDFYHGGKS